MWCFCIFNLAMPFKTIIINYGNKKEDHKSISIIKLSRHGLTRGTWLRKYQNSAREKNHIQLITHYYKNIYYATIIPNIFCKFYVLP